MKQHTILVIEDDLINREILSDILSAEYKVLTAENGRLGMELLAKHMASINLVLTDLNMPVMNGYEVLQAMAADPDMQEIPVIVTTTNDAESNEEQCLQTGASDFIPKPYNPAIVLLRVKSIIRLQEMTRSMHQKTTFMQRIGHEIRTPLNALYGVTQMLGMPDGSWSEEEKADLNRYASDSCKMLEMMINNLTYAADEMKGSINLEMGDWSLNEICQEAMDYVESTRKESVVMRFTSEVPDDFLLHTDKMRLQQVFIHLLSNACKYTEKGEIRLHCATGEKEGRLTVSVSDTGIGVPKDKAEYIFKKFTKLDEFAPGTGMGLATSRLIADKLGAKLYMDKSYGNGARFVLEIENTQNK